MSDLIDRQSVFIVVPAYNEYSVICQVIDELLLSNYKVVVIDDGSVESLYTILCNKPVYLLRHLVNLGQGAALQTGIEFSLTMGAKYIVTFDADAQHQPADVNILLEVLLESKTDIALGSRFLTGSVNNMSFIRRTILKTARYVSYLFTGVLLTDAHNGLRAMTRPAAEKINITQNRMAHATEILAQIKVNRLTYLEVPVTISYTAYSRSKGQTGWSAFRIFFDLLLSKIFR
jgi:glycosyltransferase involved in cell wall biosynthesis